MQNRPAIGTETLGETWKHLCAPPTPTYAPQDRSPKASLLPWNTCKQDNPCPPPRCRQPAVLAYYPHNYRLGSPLPSRVCLSVPRNYTASLQALGPHGGRKRGRVGTSDFYLRAPTRPRDTEARLITNSTALGEITRPDQSHPGRQTRAGGRNTRHYRVWRGANWFGNAGSAPSSKLLLRKVSAQILPNWSLQGDGKTEHENEWMLRPTLLPWGCELFSALFIGGGGHNR